MLETRSTRATPCIPFAIGFVLISRKRNIKEVADNEEFLPNDSARNTI